MPKNPKSIVISFRLSPLVIAKAIDGLKNYDKSADITRLSNIIKQTALHGINYLTSALPWEASPESQRIVMELTTQGKERSIEESILGQGAKRLLRSNITLDKDIRKEVSYLSDSTHSTVTNFSMPEELKQEIEEREEEREEEEKRNF